MASIRAASVALLIPLAAQGSGLAIEILGTHLLVASQHDPGSPGEVLGSLAVAQAGECHPAPPRLGLCPVEGRPLEAGLLRLEDRLLCFPKLGQCQFSKSASAEPLDLQGFRFPQPASADAKGRCSSRHFVEVRFSTLQGLGLPGRACGSSQASCRATLDLYDSDHRPSMAAAYVVAKGGRRKWPARDDIRDASRPGLWRIPLKTALARC